MLQPSTSLEGLSEEEMLKAAIAESLKENSPVVVSDVEDGEIFDDPEPPSPSPPPRSPPSPPPGPEPPAPPPPGSVLTGLGWSCVTAPENSAQKSFPGRGTSSKNNGIGVKNSGRV